MSHPTFRKLFNSLALIALAVSLVWPPGVATASHVQPYNPESCALGFTEFCLHTSGTGGTTTTTTTTTTTSPDTDGDGESDDKDECPKDKGATKDKNGKCPSDESGTRNSSPGALQGFIQDITRNQELYTPSGKQVASFDPDWLDDYSSTPPGTTITVPVRSGQYVLLTYAGNGSFTGQYNGGGFNFYRSDLVKKPVCDEAALARAKARLDAARAAEDKAKAAAFDANKAWYDAAAAEAAMAAEAAAAVDAFKTAQDANDAQRDADAAQAVYDSLKKNCP